MLEAIPERNLCWQGIGFGALALIRKDVREVGVPMGVFNWSKVWRLESQFSLNNCWNTRKRRKDSKTFSVRPLNKRHRWVLRFVKTILVPVSKKPGGEGGAGYWITRDGRMIATFWGVENLNNYLNILFLRGTLSRDFCGIFEKVPGIFWGWVGGRRERLTSWFWDLPLFHYPQPPPLPLSI